MEASEKAAVEKALLLVMLGYLEALRADAIVDDEAFFTIGIPALVTQMAAAGISEDVANLVGQLDEFEALGELTGPKGRDAAIQDAIGECLALLKAIPLHSYRAKPVLKLLA